MTPVTIPIFHTTDPSTIQTDDVTVRLADGPDSSRASSLESFRRKPRTRIWGHQRYELFPDVGSSSP